MGQDKIRKTVHLENVFDNVFGGFPGGSDGEESACDARDLGSTPGSGRSPGEGNGYPLQYSCLENSMDREAWWGYSPWGHEESDTAMTNMLQQLELREGCH